MYEQKTAYDTRSRDWSADVCSFDLSPGSCHRFLDGPLTSSDPTSTAPDTNPADVGSVVVIGAGPAGLTAAYELGKRGATATVLESDDVVGGISRTVVADGYRFDIGGHRFFTKVPEVEALWHEILPDEDFMLQIGRASCRERVCQYV